jgi:hypothetical protein
MQAQLASRSARLPARLSARELKTTTIRRAAVQVGPAGAAEIITITRSRSGPAFAKVTRVMMSSAAQAERRLRRMRHRLEAGQRRADLGSPGVSPAGQKGSHQRPMVLVPSADRRPSCCSGK